MTQNEYRIENLAPQFIIRALGAQVGWRWKEQNS